MGGVRHAGGVSVLCHCQSAGSEQATRLCARPTVAARWLARCRVTHVSLRVATCPGTRPLTLRGLIPAFSATPFRHRAL